MDHQVLSGVVYDFTMAGAKLGLDLKQIQELVAVEMAIQSGELELPWSQEEIEQQAQGYGPELKDTYKLTVLMAEQNFPQALRIADRGYVIVHGQIAFEGRSSAELNNNDLIRKFYLGL